MLKVPRFIEFFVMTGFDHAEQQIKVAYVLVGTQITHKYTQEIVLIKFTASFSGMLDIHTSAKKFQEGEIRFDPKVTLKRSLHTMECTRRLCR